MERLLGEDRVKDLGDLTAALFRVGRMLADNHENFTTNQARFFITKTGLYFSICMPQ